MDIPIIRFTSPSTGEVKEDQVFCSDMLDLLTKDFFARNSKGVEDEEQKQSSPVLDVVVRKNITNIPLEVYLCDIKSYSINGEKQIYILH